MCSVHLNRIQSIDVLRGLTISLMILVNTPGSWSYIYPPLKHAEWHGCTLTDLVFPSFLFIVGISFYISLSKQNLKNRDGILKKILVRASTIIFIGLLLNWFPFFHKNIGHLRYFGVLQRIGLSFLGAGVSVLLIKSANRLALFATLLLLTHWALLYFLGGNQPYSLYENMTIQVDTFLFGESHIYGGFGVPFDPEGLIGTISSVAQVIIGYLIAEVTLKNGTISKNAIFKLLFFSILLLLAGMLWSQIYPLNKPLWTGSFVLYTSGIGGITWGLLIVLIDQKKIDFWTSPIRVFGQNPLISFILSIAIVKILLYVLKSEDGNLYGWLYISLFQPVFGNYFGSFMFAFIYTFFIWLFAYWLYRKGKMIKV